MTKKEYEFIKIKNRWSLTFKDFYSRFFFIFFPVCIIFIGSIAASAGFSSNVSDLKIASLVILTIGILLTVFLSISLVQTQFFKIFQFPKLSRTQIESALAKAQLGNFKFYNIGYFEIITKTSWFSWGEKITIIYDEGRILINSRPTGSSFSFQPITIFKDKRNIKTFVKALTELNKPD